LVQSCANINALITTAPIFINEPIKHTLVISTSIVGIVLFSM